MRSHVQLGLLLAGGGAALGLGACSAGGPIRVYVEPTYEQDRLQKILATHPEFLVLQHPGTEDVTLRVEGVPRESPEAPLRATLRARRGPPGRRPAPLFAPASTAAAMRSTPWPSSSPCATATAAAPAGCRASPTACAKTTWTASSSKSSRKPPPRSTGTSSGPSPRSSAPCTRPHPRPDFSLPELFFRQEQSG